MDVIDADCPGDDEAWLEGELDTGVVEKVGDVVCPWQFPLLTETSSIAKSPV